MCWSSGGWIVWDARLKHLIELMTELEQAGIGFQSLQEHIDTTSPGGKLVFHIFGALAEFERNLIQERTKAGLEAARARGRKGGRPKSLTAQQRALALDLYTQRKHTVEEICRTLGISKPTLYAYVRGESRSLDGRSRPPRTQAIRGHGKIIGFPKPIPGDKMARLYPSAKPIQGRAQGPVIGLVAARGLAPRTLSGRGQPAGGRAAGRSPLAAQSASRRHRHQA